MLNALKILKLRWHRALGIIDECKVHGFLRNKSDLEIELLTKQFKHLKEEYRKERQVLHRQNRKAIILDAVFEDADSH